jgi:V8-like Glu-specific endopeptidase
MSSARAGLGSVRSVCRLLSTLAFAVLAITGPVAAAQNGAEVAYGKDNRIETRWLKGGRAKNAAAIMALVRVTAIKNNGNGTSTLKGPTLQASQGLCPGQRFAAQPTPAFCSGVLLSPNVVATAGHCVGSAAELAQIRFVLDFAMIDAEHARTTLPNGRIYRGKRLLARRLDDATENDYAVVELERAVRDRQPAVLQRTGRIATATPLYVIGHPSGLPAKVAGHATVQGNANPLYFEANLDTFGGNSGSPVFDARTDRVVGLLVRGADDYVRTAKGCYVVNVLPENAGDEDVTRGPVFAPYVPAK